MLTKDFSYNLPKELIANEPISPRDSSKLMVLNRKDNSIKHRIFNEFPAIISNEYVLVFNKTKVFPAKLIAKINEKECELLMLKEIDINVWKCMVKPGKRFKIETKVKLIGSSNEVEGVVISINKDGTRNIKFNHDNFFNWVEENGKVPLPPYIKNENSSLNEYQTIYAEETGSIAAPTAGFHFTDKTFEDLKTNKIQSEFVTLHVGRGTFLPVKTDTIEDHEMHSEIYDIDQDTADRLNKAKKDGKKILAVGTTVVRTLESNFKNGQFCANREETRIFIFPGYKFGAVDGIFTNFHLPESTLLMLISAFSDRDFIFKAYQEAIKKKYRFYSFGDAMLII